MARTVRHADRYVSVGFQIALSLVAYVLVGHWLDERFGTGPWLTALGAVLGFVTMMFLIIRLAKLDSGPTTHPRTDDGDRAGANPSDGRPP